MHVEVRGLLSTIPSCDAFDLDVSHVTSAGSRWTDSGYGDRDDFEEHSVWSSTDVRDVVQELMEYDSSQLVFVLDIMVARGVHSVASFGKSGEYSPALFVEFE